MKTNQPKYITYKGSRYQRVDSINEMEVRNIAPGKRWCVVQIDFFDRMRHLTGINLAATDGKKIYTPPDFLSIEDVLNSVENSEYVDDEFFSIHKLDDYTYCGSLDTETIYMVCTRYKGVGKRVYELVEESSDDSRLIKEAIDTIEGVFGPVEDFL